jgi:PhzF family phenazine biosynthesis protein
MELPYYHVAAFTGEQFHGNPAGVCLLKEWPADELLQNIARENNLSETAFLVGSNREYELRWFTPQVEVDLCGHATLAAGFVLFNLYDAGSGPLLFHSQSGDLQVRRDGQNDMFFLDFPSRPPRKIDCPELLTKGLGAVPQSVLTSRDLVAVFASPDEITALQPDFSLLRRLDALGIIVTAPSTEVDFVSRFFAPAVGIDEDPVTGSAHCTLVPYWAGRLGRKELTARQLSARGGELLCRDEGERVRIGGRAVLYLSGTLHLEGH